MKYKENILNLVKDYQYKRGITYPKTDERAYHNLRVCYIIGFIYQAIFMFLLIYGQATTGYLTGNSIFTAAIISFCFFTAAFILMFFKLDIISLPLNILGTVFLWPIMREVLFLSGVFFIKGTFYVKHLIPLVLIFVPSIWMSVISTRERHFIKRDYKFIMNKLYTKHRTEEMDDSQWEEFINNYKA